MRISSSVLWLASAYLLSGCSGSSSPQLSASDSSSSSSSVLPRLSRQEPAVLARTLTPITQITQQALDGSGRYMVFSSTASNLVSGDTNGVADVFLYDRYLRVHKRISLGGGAVEANGASYRAVISADARYVVYDSLASNLVNGDTNQRTDVFVYDRNNNTTTRVSQKGGVQGNGASDQAAVSGDGNLIAFRSASTNLSLNDNNRASDIFVWNRSTGQLDRVTDLSRESRNPFLSTDANWLSYDSNAIGRYQVYRRALGTGLVTQLTTSTLGDSYGAAMNRDGSMVAFTSSASDLVAGDSNGLEDIFVWSASETVRIGGNGRSSMPSLSADGSLLAFISSASDLLAGDSNGVADAYLTVLDGTRRIWRQSVAADNLSQPGAQADQESAQACIDPTGAVVAFRSYATNLDPADSNGSDDDLFLRDSESDFTALASQPRAARASVQQVDVSAGGMGADSADFFGPCQISADGRYVVFCSNASNLLANGGGAGLGRQIYLKDMETGLVELISRGASGPANAGCDWPAVSANGRFVAFNTVASNLVPGDTNNLHDVFLRDRWLDTLERVNLRDDGSPSQSGGSGRPTISDDGRIVPFETDERLVPSLDNDSAWDVYVRDRQTNTTQLISVDSAGQNQPNGSYYPSINLGGGGGSSRPHLPRLRGRRRRLGAGWKCPAPCLR